jgi:hypothetical protein
VTLPSTVKLPARKIWNQGKEINCCLSCALATCFEALYASQPALAPLFHYWWARADRRNPAPLTTSAGFLAGRMQGFCALELHNKEFTVAGASDSPSDRANLDGLKRRIGLDPQSGERLYYWLPRSDAAHYWRKALASKYPILLGIHPDTSYDKLEEETDTWIPSGGRTSQVGHAVAVLGYEDSPGRFIAQDSRGTAFAAGGQWYLPYELASSNAVSEAYAIGASPTKGLYG